jgi:hypothetical protein
MAWKKTEGWDERKEIEKLIGSNREIGALYNTIGYNRFIDCEFKRLLDAVTALIQAERPTDAVGFVRLLDRLADLCEDRRNPQPERVKQAILDAIAKLREDFEKDTLTLQTSVDQLKEEIEAAANLSQDFKARIKKEQLDKLLLEIVNVQHEYIRRFVPDYFYLVLPHSLAPSSIQEYLDNPWMHIPWLTQTLLTIQLDADLTFLRPPHPSLWKMSLAMIGAIVLGFISWKWKSLTDYWFYVAMAGLIGWGFWPEIAFGRGMQKLSGLNSVRFEVANGYYDSRVLTRRLREEERKGLYVHSLIYPLLRLGRSPSQPPES